MSNWIISKDLSKQCWCLLYSTKNSIFSCILKISLNIHISVCFFVCFITEVLEFICSIIFIPETLKYWFGVQRGQSYLMGRRCLFSHEWPLFQWRYHDKNTLQDRCFITSSYFSSSIKTNRSSIFKPPERKKRIFKFSRRNVCLDDNFVSV